MKDSKFPVEDDEPGQSGEASVADLALALVLTAAVATVVYVAIQLW
jgi:hypothetical protein